MFFFVPMMTNLLCFSDEEGELDAPLAKKPKTGSAKSVNSRPEASKQKSSSAPVPTAAAENALTRMLTKNKNAETSAAVVTPSSAAAAASSKEHVSYSAFVFHVFFGLLQLLSSSQVAPEPVLVCEQASVGSVGKK